MKLRDSAPSRLPARTLLTERFHNETWFRGHCPPPGRRGRMAKVLTSGGSRRQAGSRHLVDKSGQSGTLGLRRAILRNLEEHPTTACIAGGSADPVEGATHPDQKEENNVKHDKA